MSATAPPNDSLHVIHVVHSLDPATGGPARTVPALARAQRRAGARAEIFVCENGGATIEDVPVTVVEPSGRGGRAMRRALAGHLAALASTACTVVHVHGLWRGSSHGAVVAARRAGRPYVISPRGMLDPWALQQRAGRKRLALRTYQGRDLRGATVLHATAPLEVAGFRVLGRVPPVATVPNGVDVEGLPDPVWGASRQSEPRRALFLSRIHPKKGLLELVEAWAAIRPAGWALDLVGPDESGHASVVQAAINRHGLRDQVQLRGAAEGQAKHDAYERAQLFVLPTKSENFGVVVAEALASGVPALTTTAAPWEGLKAHGCGWWVTTEGPSLREALRAATSSSPNDLAAMGQRGAAWVREAFAWDAVGQRMNEVHRWVLAPSSPKPSAMVGVPS